MRRVVDWLFTGPFLVTFGLVLGLFDPIQRIARPDLGPEIVVGCCEVFARRLSPVAPASVDRSARSKWTPAIVSNPEPVRRT
jgi:hypothetical protein